MSLDAKVDALRTLLIEIEHDFAPATFANSFGAEDMLLMDAIARFAPSIEIFSLDTGRLPQETYTLMQAAQEKYRLRIKVYFPEAQAVESFVATHSINGFYANVEARKACCEVRKVAPLRRALAGKRAWLTGLRREQSVTRQSLALSAFDKDHALQKFNPLADWSEADVWAYIKAHDVPYNELHEKGFPSIGCAPCTRAIRPGEDVRAGRWWWENPEHKECGLHVTQSAPAQTVSFARATAKVQL